MGTKIYLKSEDFQKEYNISLSEGQPTEKLILMFTKIARNFCTTFIYVNSCDKSACINFAVSEAWIKWNKYDSKISDNIFSFFTTMISNDLRLHYNQITKGKKVNISIESLFESSEN